MNTPCDPRIHGDPAGCNTCDGYGCCWNNGDSTSGQWQPCPDCGDTRGRP